MMRGSHSMRDSSNRIDALVLRGIVIGAALLEVGAAIVMLLIDEN